MYDFVTAFFCFGISWFSYFYYLQRVVILRGNHLGIINDVCGNIILRVLGVKTLHILSVILHWNLRQLFLWITINCTRLTKGGGTFFLLLVVVIFLFLFNYFIKQHHASLFILLIFYIILWYLVYKLFGLQSTLNLLLFNFFKTVPSSLILSAFTWVGNSGTSASVFKLAKSFGFILPLLFWFRPYLVSLWQLLLQKFTLKT